MIPTGTLLHVAIAGHKIPGSCQVSGRTNELRPAADDLRIRLLLTGQQLADFAAVRALLPPANAAGEIGPVDIDNPALSQAGRRFVIKSIDGPSPGKLAGTVEFLLRCRRAIVEEGGA